MEANIMGENRVIHLIEIPIGGRGGLIWNRLHGEREEICEALLKDSDLVSDELRELLQTRLRRIDEALDRLMSGSYGICSKCGRAIDDSRLDVDAAAALCLDCWASEQGGVYSTVNNSARRDVDLNNLQPFDTILLRTHNSDYRILLLDPKTGRALVEGGQHFVEPSETLLKGSAMPGSLFKGGSICVGGRLEMWCDERAFITSAIRSVQVKHNAAAESVQNISEALH